MKQNTLENIGLMLCLLFLLAGGLCLRWGTKSGSEDHNDD